VETYARPLSSTPHAFERITDRVWSAYDYTDSILIKVRMDSATAERVAGRCQLLVQLSLKVAQDVPRPDGTIPGQIRGIVWLPPVSTYWVDCSSPARLAQDGGAVTIGYFQPDSTLGHLRLATWDAALLALRIDVTMVDSDHRHTIGSIRI